MPEFAESWSLLAETPTQRNVNFFLPPLKFLNSVIYAAKLSALLICAISLLVT